MARLMPGGQLPLMLGDHAAFLLRPGHHFDLRFLQICHGNKFPVLSGDQQRSFIEQILQIRAGEARRSPGDHPQIHILRQGPPLGMDLQNLFRPRISGSPT